MIVKQIHNAMDGNIWKYTVDTMVAQIEIYTAEAYTIIIPEIPRSDFILSSSLGITDMKI